MTAASITTNLFCAAIRRVGAPVVFLTLLALGAGYAHAQKNLSVEGMGFFENRRLRSQLAFFHGIAISEKLRLDSSVIEESGFFLIQQLLRNGYLEPEMAAILRTGDEERLVRWDGVYPDDLDLHSVADSMVFRITPGALFYYDSVVVNGVNSMGRSRRKRFFVPHRHLLVRRRDRAFTPANLAKRADDLVRHLHETGRRSAVETGRYFEAGAGGAVRVEVNIDEGPVHRVRSMEVIVDGEKASFEDFGRLRRYPVYRPEWERQQRQLLRDDAYRRGYPDVSVKTERAASEVLEDGDVLHDLLSSVDLGKQVSLRRVLFENGEFVKEHVLRRQADLGTGMPLDLTEAAEARRRLLGLGIFRDVKMRFSTVDESSRDVVYELIPAHQRKLSFLAGWGSYEQARAGIRWERTNPWRLAHRYELGAKKSVRSTDADAIYSIPRFLGTAVTAHGGAEYSFRELLSYNRTTTGLKVGGSSPLGRSDVVVSVDYALEAQRTDIRHETEFETLDRAVVSSVSTRASLDRRDDVLYPAGGFNLFGGIKTASGFTGGDVDFQRVEIGGSAHHEVASSIVLHMALRYGHIYSWRGRSLNIPFNERFFPGGANSVRGYKEGAASPLDSAGREIGAESYLLANAEIEHRLLRNVSAVLFGDAVNVSRDRQLDAGSEVLYSVGGGIRYRTIVGPIRVEYGRNVRPRPLDASGALHFSIGFPL